MVIGDEGDELQVTLRFHALLGDEEALTQAWGLKGASGTVPCGLMCGRLTNKRRPTDIQRGLRHLCEISPHLAHFASITGHGRRTNSDVWQICDELEGCKGTERNAKEENSGIKYIPQGLLFFKALRPFVLPVDTNRFDGMHVLFSNGVGSSEMILCDRHFSAHIGKKLFPILREVSAWFSPKVSMFSEAREAGSSDLLRCTAAEVVEGYKLYRYALVQVFGPEPTEGYVLSALALFSVMDLIIWLTRSVVPAGWELGDTVRVLRRRIETYLERAFETHGLDDLRLKHHEMTHLAEQILKDGRFLNAFVNERKNRRVKEAASQQLRASSVARTCLSRCLCVQERLLNEYKKGDHLEGATRQVPELGCHCFSSRNCRLDGHEFRGGRFYVVDLAIKTTFFVVGWTQLFEGTEVGAIARKCSIVRVAECAQSAVIRLEKPLGLFFRSSIAGGVFSPISFWRRMGDADDEYELLY